MRGIGMFSRKKKTEQAKRQMCDEYCFYRKKAEEIAAEKVMPPEEVLNQLFEELDRRCMACPLNDLR